MKRALLALLLACASVAGAQETRLATLYAEKIFCDAGVSKVNVDVHKKEVLVQFDPAKATVDDLTAATAKKGFPSTVRRLAP